MNDCVHLFCLGTRETLFIFQIKSTEKCDVLKAFHGQFLWGEFLRNTFIFITDGTIK